MNEFNIRGTILAILIVWAVIGVAYLVH